MSAALETMPILTAIGGMSSNTASIWSARISGSAFCTARTPVVFCAVSDVMADMPNTPLASIVFRSAWMPAPPEESDPATVSTGGRPCGCLTSNMAAPHCRGAATSDCGWEAADAATPCRAAPRTAVHAWTSSRVARSGSSAAAIAETTNHPSAAVRASAGTSSACTPPPTTTGYRLASHNSCAPAMPSACLVPSASTAAASGLVAV